MLGKRWSPGRGDFKGLGEGLSLLILFPFYSSFAY
jgi:hypothetical protein